MFCALTYLFGHSIYFARLRHVNPQCKHKCAFLQMKEAPNQKVQEKKPLLKFKNTKKNMCLERIWRKKCFWACRHRPLMESCFLLRSTLPVFRIGSILCISSVLHSTLASGVSSLSIHDDKCILPSQVQIQVQSVEDCSFGQDYENFWVVTC